MKKRKKPKDRDIYDSVFSKVLNFLSYRGRTKRELSCAIDKYLSKYDLVKDMEPVKEKVLGKLEDLGFIDDFDFACSYIRSKKSSSKPMGRFLLVKFLYKKGVSRSDIDKALELEYPREVEFEAALKIADKKLVYLRKFEGWKKRIKLMNYLSSRGFSGDIISAVVDTKAKKG